MKSSFIFVLIKPGQIVFTRIPSFTWSNARHLVNCITAPFDVQYATVLGQPINPATEELLIIEPPPFFIIRGTTYLHIRNKPFTLMSIILSHDSRVVVVTVPGSRTPALLNSISSFLN